MDKERTIGEAVYAGALYAEASANHTLSSGHESWSHPGIGWTCADPLCDAYNAELAAKIDANAPDVRKPHHDPAKEGARPGAVKS